MEHKIKVKLDGRIVRLYYWEKYWFIFGQWVPYKNTAYGSTYDAYAEYHKLCVSINPFFKPKF